MPYNTLKREKVSGCIIALNNPVGYLGLLSGEMGIGGIPLNERPDRYFHSPANEIRFLPCILSFMSSGRPYIPPCFCNWSHVWSVQPFRVLPAYREFCNSRTHRLLCFVLFQSRYNIQCFHRQCSPNLL